MSTDYAIFLNADSSREEILSTLCGAAGLDVENGIRIPGLTSVTCAPLTASHQEAMLHDYGIYGLEVNWAISGTYDDESDIFDLIERLHQCAAALVRANPNAPLSLMRNGEDFYVFNKQDELILAPTYVRSMPVLGTFFEKPFAVTAMPY